MSYVSINVWGYVLKKTTVGAQLSPCDLPLLTYLCVSDTKESVAQ